jgi:hypothetical protein
MNTGHVISSIAIGLTIINTLLVVNSSYRSKQIGLTLDIIIISLLIAIVWIVYGYVEKLNHILYGNIIIILLLLFLLFLYYKYA